jgi:NADH-quinone oxidoreductase subunit F
MFEPLLFKNRRPERPATLDEYRAGGGYEGLTYALRNLSPEDVRQLVKDSGLRGRGGAGFPTGRKWEGVPVDGPFPRYILANSDEMEPGTFKDRVLINVDPHRVIEGVILAGYAVSAGKGVFFIRPTYETEAALLEKEVAAAGEAGYLGRDILGSGFGFEIKVHRSGGRYICGEASAQVKALEGERPHPDKTAHMAQKGLWERPTIVNNVETLAYVPDIVRKGPEWFQGLAQTGAGTKLYCVSGRVRNPGCFELPLGTRLSEIIEKSAGGMLPGSTFKACLPGGASTGFLPAEFYDIQMDFDVLKEAGQRLGTGAIIVFDEETCLVGATLKLMTYFARESCGFCTPCREGLPFVRDLLHRIEAGQGEVSFIPMLKEMCGAMSHAYCDFAQGAVAPLIGLLTYFEEEILEHISRHKCPYGPNPWPRETAEVPLCPA